MWRVCVCVCVCVCARARAQRCEWMPGHCQCRCQHLQIADAEGGRALHQAVLAENAEAVKMLVDAGADTNSDDNSKRQCMPRPLAEWVANRRGMWEVEQGREGGRGRQIARGQR